jgi:hypothetical protein
MRRVKILPSLVIPVIDVFAQNYELNTCEGLRIEGLEEMICGRTT